MLKIFNALVVAGISLLITSCGGDSSPASTAAAPTSSFTSSAGVGELLTFTADTTALTYSYTVTASSYGLEGNMGSGTLTENSDGSYTPSEFPSSKIQVYQNGLMVGAVEFTINGQTVNSPVVGVSSPITSLASLAGTYNFLGESCEGPTASSNTGVGICNTVHGTVVIDTDGTYEACTGADLTTDPSCGGGALTSGTIVSAGNGLFEFNRTGTAFIAVTNANYLLASAAPNGQNVLIIDTNDSAGYGYGHLVGSTQTSTVDTATAPGTWTWNANNGDSGTFDLTCSSSTECASSSGANITIGTPWAGLGTVVNGPFNYYVLVAGSGVYVQAAAPSQVIPFSGGAYNTYMEIGAHQ